MTTSSNLLKSSNPFPQSLNSHPLYLPSSPHCLVATPPPSCPTSGWQTEPNSSRSFPPPRPIGQVQVGQLSSPQSSKRTGRTVT
ncbi:hypothetical protein VTL71DRAFT_1747, partial [Oculimacula yallundae]